LVPANSQAKASRIEFAGATVYIASIAFAILRALAPGAGRHGVTYA